MSPRPQHRRSPDSDTCNLMQSPASLTLCSATHVPQSSRILFLGLMMRHITARGDPHHNTRACAFFFVFVFVFFCVCVCVCVCWLCVVFQLDGSTLYLLSLRAHLILKFQHRHTCAMLVLTLTRPVLGTDQRYTQHSTCHRHKTQRMLTHHRLTI